MIHLAIFASGGGSNAAKIIAHFVDHPAIRVRLVVCNKPGAGVIDIAQKAGIEVLIIDKSHFHQSDWLLSKLQEREISFIALAGFLWLIPTYLVEVFDGRMLNIHPALLPAFGGKGMHGMHIHEAVRAANMPETGITIHLVNAEYDKGAPIFQAKCDVNVNDDSATIASNVLRLEHIFYPKVIEAYISQKAALASS